MAVMSQQAWSQQNVWSLPDYQETVRTASVSLGNAFARDTYLSASHYDGFACGFEPIITQDPPAASALTISPE